MNREYLTIIGTAHVSEESVKEVKDTIYEQQPDIVAIELDRGRYNRIRNEMAGIEEDSHIPVTQIIKENKNSAEKGKKNATPKMLKEVEGKEKVRTSTGIG